MKSFESKIFVGFKEFTNIERTEYIEHTLKECEDICQEYCNDVGLCVSVTTTKYIYTKGNECGAIIGLIQYPRFPLDEYQLKKYTLELGQTLMKSLGQFRVTINFNDEVVMLTNNTKINE